MQNTLPGRIWQLRSQFLRDTRSFLDDSGYLELTTPLLNPGLIIEPFMDYFSVARPGSLKQRIQAPGPEYLPASPECNLKIAMAACQTGIYEIAHCFRAGERSDQHSEEFLMLEWYRPGFDEINLAEEVGAFICYLAGRPYSRQKVPEIRRRTIQSCFMQYCGIVPERQALLELLELPANCADRYDELFFLAFLNHIEPHLGTAELDIIHDYPPELCALARVENGRARRFEVYWKRIELANGFFELIDAAEQKTRFQKDKDLRQAGARDPVADDPQFMETLEGGSLPNMAGVALGMDRLLMVLLDEPSLATVSPFYRPV